MNFVTGSNLIYVDYLNNGNISYVFKMHFSFSHQVFAPSPCISFIIMINGGSHETYCPKKGGHGLQLPPQVKMMQKVFFSNRGRKDKKKGTKAEATFNLNLSLGGEILKGSLGVNRNVQKC